MQLPQLLHRFDSVETRIPFYTRVTKGKKKRSRPKDKKPKKTKKETKKRKVRRWSTNTVLGRSLDAKTPLFSASRHRQTLSLFLLFSPLTKSGRQVKLSDSLDSFGFLGFSELLCRLPFFRLSHLNPCVSPDFRVSTLFFPLVSLSWRRFTVCFFLSLYSQLGFTLCGPLVILPYFLPSTLPTLLVTVETTHVCLSTWLPSS